MKCINMWIRAAGVTAAVGLTLSATAGCGGSSKTAEPAKTDSTSTAVASSATTPAEPSASPSPVLADGRNAVYLTGLNAGGKTVTFDLIEFLTGDAAKALWKKEHPDNPDGPDNDYMIVNNNTKLRTLPVAADATCLVLATLGSTDTKKIGFAALPAFLKEQHRDIALTPPQIAALPFWLTVKDGTVVKFEEQFLP